MHTYAYRFRTRSRWTRLARLAAVAGVAIVLLVVLLPQPRADDSRQVEAVLEIAQAFGAAERAVTGSGMQGIVAEIDGFAYTLSFYQCDGAGGCQGVQFMAHFKALASLRELELWNNQADAPRAFHDAIGGTSLTQNVALDNTLDPLPATELLANWGNAVFDFDALIGS